MTLAIITLIVFGGVGVATNPHVHSHHKHYRPVEKFPKLKKPILADPLVRKEKLA